MFSFCRSYIWPDLLSCATSAELLPITSPSPIDDALDPVFQRLTLSVFYKKQPKELLPKQTLLLLLKPVSLMDKAVIRAFVKKPLKALKAYL